MKHIQIANEMYISCIGIGCWSFGGGDYWGDQNQADVQHVVDYALDNGVNFFDTARMYNNGNSEKSLGAALKGKRDSAIVCSKVSPANAYYATLKHECEQSLINLGADYVDIYMLHWPINPFGIKHFTQDPDIIKNPPTAEEAFAALNDLKKEGKIRAIGVSNFGVKQLSEATNLCSELSVNEMPYNILSRAIEAEIVPFCEKNSISIITSMTLQQGLLAGIYKNAGEVPSHQAHSRHFAHSSGKGTSRHFEDGAEDEIFAAIPKLQDIASDLNISLAELSIAWALSKRGISSCLVGCRNANELKVNLTAAFVDLPSDAIALIDEISHPILCKLGNNPDYYENTKNSRIY